MSMLHRQTFMPCVCLERGKQNVNYGSVCVKRSKMTVYSGGGLDAVIF